MRRFWRRPGESGPSGDATLLRIGNTIHQKSPLLTWEASWEKLLLLCCGRRWIRTTEGINQQIYSLPHLATLVSSQGVFIRIGFGVPTPTTFSFPASVWADGGIRTPDQLITNQLLWPTELHRQSLPIRTANIRINSEPAKFWRKFLCSQRTRFCYPPFPAPRSLLHTSLLPAACYLTSNKATFAKSSAKIE